MQSEVNFPLPGLVPPRPAAWLDVSPAVCLSVCLLSPGPPRALDLGWVPLVP